MKNPIENKIVKYGVWLICYGLLVAYFLFIVQTKIIKREDLNLNTDDYIIMGGALTLLITYEAARAFLKRKAESK